MRYFPRNILSAILTATFVIVAISGVLMFFKIRLFAMESIHIWLGLAFVLVGVLHLFKNWNAFSGYFKKNSTFTSIITVAVICSLFVAIPLLNPKEKGVSPKQKIFTMMMVSPLANLAQFVNLDADIMVKNLQEKAKIVATTKQSVEEIAKVSGKASEEILQIILSEQTK